MSGFLKALAKVGLVELDAEQSRALEQTLDPDEARRIVREARGSSSTPTAGSASAGASARAGAPTSAASRTRGGASKSPSAPAHAAHSERQAHPSAEAVGFDAARSGSAVGAASEIEEGRPFEMVYGSAGVSSSPFPAEKLIKVLDGLRAMDPATRKAAILAMDAADDDWKIEDPIVDAERKIRALEAEKARLGAVVEASATRLAAELETIQGFEEEARTKIKKQIEDLEALLARELAKGAEARAKNQVQLEANRDASRRERARIDAEIVRLQEIALTFEDSSAPDSH
ncbi:MAG: hypothetical protein H6729_17515 [Deltaproteobacteria bacterium]|nr:hypothetical protein [Deltaproteobacteria bacterium]